MFEEGVDRAEPGGHVGDARSGIAYAAEEGPELVDVGGHWHFGEGGDLLGAKAKASGANGVSQGFGVGGAKFIFGGERSRWCSRRRWNTARMLSTREAGSGSNTMTSSR